MVVTGSAAQEYDECITCPPGKNPGYKHNLPRPMLPFSRLRNIDPDDYELYLQNIDKRNTPAMSVHRNMPVIPDYISGTYQTEEYQDTEG
jgi:hypothetical protein